MSRLILMRGLSGSGKTHLANRMAQQQNGKVFSPTEAGKDWSFNETDEYYSHYVNQKHVYNALKENVKLIIIDACNIKPMFATPYIRMAKKFNYNYLVMQPATDWARNPRECWKKCDRKTQLANILEQNRLMNEIPIHVFNHVMDVVEPFNPYECIKEAQLAMENENPCHADELVIDYEEWRGEGGFAPFGGDEAMVNISEKLKSWRDNHWQGVSWLPESQTRLHPLPLLTKHCSCLD